MRVINVVALAVLLLCISRMPAYGNLVQATEWTSLVAQDKFGNGNLCSPPCTPPQPVIDLAANNIIWANLIDIGFGVLRQTFPTTPGITYRVQYDLEVLNGNGGFGPGPLSRGEFFAIFNGDIFQPSSQIPCVNSDECGTLFGGFRNHPGHFQEVFTDVATSTSTTLIFSGATFNEFFVGPIFVTAVPEPMTLILVGVVGCFGVALRAIYKSGETR